jgi:hypothetical protein
VQFGLLRLDLTPRPAYVALATVGRCLAGARALGRWRPEPNVEVYAFSARPDGREQDVLVIWAEKEVDWEGRGQTTSAWRLPSHLTVQGVVDYLGRALDRGVPSPLTSAPVFVLLPPGQAATLPLVCPPAVAPAPPGRSATPLVLQLALPHETEVRVEDRPWSEGYAYGLASGQTHRLPIHLYNFGATAATARLALGSKPADWGLSLPDRSFEVLPDGRVELAVTLEIPPGTPVKDGWLVIEAEGGNLGRSPLAFRVRVR